MNNLKISVKERNLIKGAIRRVFSRSDLRKEALIKSIITYYDESRKRVTKWSRCPICTQPTPTYTMEVDHVIPVVPLDKNLEDMTWDELVNNVWCDAENLVAICKPCHKIKSGQERKLRVQFKKEKLK